MKIGRDGRPIRRRDGAIVGGLLGFGLLCVKPILVSDPDPASALLISACFVLPGATLGALLGPALGRLVDRVAPDPFPRPDRGAPPLAPRVPAIKPLRRQSKLGGLAIAVAVAGVGLALLVRVPGFGGLVLGALAVLLVMMGGACAFACVGVAFGRLALPTVHPLSDHAVGYHGLDPAQADPEIVFEPVEPT